MSAALERAKEAAEQANAATSAALAKMEQGGDGTMVLAAEGGMSDRATIEASLLGLVEGEPDFTLVIVKHVWTSEEVLSGGELTGAEYNPGVFFNELEEELNAELGKYGGVLALAALTETSDGQIGIRYSDAVTAARGIDVMEGRGFAGRTLKADYYDGTRHHCGSELPRWRTGEAAPLPTQEPVREETEAAESKEDSLSAPDDKDANDESDDPLPTGWEVYTTKDARLYYHNKELGSTVWNRPRLSKTEKERIARLKRAAEKKDKEEREAAEMASLLGAV